MKRLLFGLPLLFTVTTLLAQSATPDDSPSAAASAGMLGLGIGCAILFYGGLAVLWIGGAIWVMRDAKRRNSPNATLVTVLTWIPCTWAIGIIVHLITRPKTMAPGAPPPPM